MLDRGLKRHVRSFDSRLLDDGEVSNCIAKLDEHVRNTNRRKMRREHLKTVKTLGSKA